MAPSNKRTRTTARLTSSDNYEASSSTDFPDIANSTDISLLHKPSSSTTTSSSSDISTYSDLALH